MDLFGHEPPKSLSLRDEFLEPPFSVLDTKSASWGERMTKWKSIGIKSEVGRNIAYSYGFSGNHKCEDRTSIFDPVLCELMYRWFCPENGMILDPFSGGSVRGIVASKLGFNYTGIDIRQEQIDSNREQSDIVCDVKNRPNYYVGDSNCVLDSLIPSYDMVFSCPPYADLEVYSDLENDISNMPYNQFMVAYESIISKSCNKLKTGGFAVFVVGEVRDKRGNYYGFVPDTINAFKKCGMNFYNEAILLNQIASASMRANGNMKSKKLAKVHQNVLVFKK